MTNEIPSPPEVVVRPRPLERLEAEIVALAGQLAAATCRWLGLVGEFDAAEGWREWGMRSTAQWLSWQCGMGLVTAREHVRVARALRELPLVRSEFAAGRLSFSKVRAITRVATPATEAMLVEWADHATAAQLDRIVTARRRVTRAEDVQARRAARFVRWRWDDDGSLVGSFRLTPGDGARLLLALDVGRERLAGTGTGTGTASAEALGDTPAEARDGSAEARGDAPAEASAARSSADALMLMADTLMSQRASADPRHAERYQVLVHTTVDDVRAEQGDAALHTCIEGGPVLTPDTARRITCDCAMATMWTDPSGTPLHAGRSTRRIGRRLRRAVQVRDHGRCRGPGCGRRAVEIHHIRHWAHGGTTCLPNLISLCAEHHWLVHEGGWRIATPASDVRRWIAPDGRRLDEVPGVRTVEEPLAVDAGVDADGITDKWAGESLHLNDAIAALCTAPRRLPPYRGALADPRRVHGPDG